MAKDKDSEKAYAEAERIEKEARAGKAQMWKIEYTPKNNGIVITTPNNKVIEWKNIPNEVYDKYPIGQKSGAKAMTIEQAQAVIQAIDTDVKEGKKKYGEHRPAGTARKGGEAPKADFSKVASDKPTKEFNPNTSRAGVKKATETVGPMASEELDIPAKPGSFEKVDPASLDLGDAPKPVASPVKDPPAAKAAAAEKPIPKPSEMGIDLPDVPIKDANAPKGAAAPVKPPAVAAVASKKKGDAYVVTARDANGNIIAEQTFKTEAEAEKRVDELSGMTAEDKARDKAEKAAAKKDKPPAAEGEKKEAFGGKRHTITAEDRAKAAATRAAKAAAAKGGGEAPAPAAKPAKVKANPVEKLAQQVMKDAGMEGSDLYRVAFPEAGMTAEEINRMGVSRDYRGVDRPGGPSIGEATTGAKVDVKDPRARVPAPTMTTPITTKREPSVGEMSASTGTPIEAGRIPKGDVQSGAPAVIEAGRPPVGPKVGETAGVGAIGQVPPTPEHRTQGPFEPGRGPSVRDMSGGSLSAGAHAETTPSALYQDSSFAAKAIGDAKKLSEAAEKGGPKVTEAISKAVSEMPKSGKNAILAGAITTAALTAAGGYMAGRATQHGGYSGVDEDPNIFGAEQKPVPGGKVKGTGLKEERKKYDKEQAAEEKKKSEGKGGGDGTTDVKKWAAWTNDLFQKTYERLEAEDKRLEQEFKDVVGKHKEMSATIMQRGLLAKMIEEVGESPTKTELEGIMLNAMYKLPPAVYSASIGNVIKGYMAAKKNGIPVPEGDPAALMGLAEYGKGQKAGTSMTQMVMDFALESIGKDFELTVKPLGMKMMKHHDRVLAFDQARMQTTMNMISHIITTNAMVRGRMYASDKAHPDGGGFDFSQLQTRPSQEQ